MIGTICFKPGGGLPVEIDLATIRLVHPERDEGAMLSGTNGHKKQHHAKIISQGPQKTNYKLSGWRLKNV